MDHTPQVTVVTVVTVERRIGAPRDRVREALTDRR